MLLTACILEFNESDRLKETIENVDQYVDEIVVVSNGQFDKSITSSNNKIKHVNGNSLEYDLARNLYLDHANGDWILVIDCDERIFSHDLKKLRNLLNNTNCDALITPRYDYLGNGNWAQIEVLRIFKNNKNIRYNSSPIHASVYTSIKKNNGNFKYEDIGFHHFDLLINEKKNISKRMRNIELLDKEINKPEHSVFLHAMLGLELAALDNYSLALEQFDIGYSLNSQSAALFKAQLLYDLGELKDSQKILDVIVKTDDFFLLDKIYVLKANILLKTNKEKELQEMVKFALKKYPNSIHWNINAAYLTNDKNERKSLILKSLTINANLANPCIYKDIQEKNLFWIQRSLLDGVNKSLEMECYELYGN